jgi:GH24 family phage-related lysozyme (muramidase)
MAEMMKKAEDITRRAGGSQGTQLEAGQMTPLMQDIVNFIAAREGFAKFPTKDPGADQFNIGHGTYTGRDDVQAGLEAAGTTLEQVKKHGITKEQAAILTSFVVATHEAYLRRTFKGFPLRAHQRKALHSFIYSSRWENGSPTVMGPKIISAIKSGNDALVAQMIRNTLKVADPTANIQNGMQNRRNKEANMYMGTSRLSTD